jgi:hypothetical protein
MSEAFWGKSGPQGRRDRSKESSTNPLRFRVVQMGFGRAKTNIDSRISETGKTHAA